MDNPEIVAHGSLEFELKTFCRQEIRTEASVFSIKQILDELLSTLKDPLLDVISALGDEFSSSETYIRSAALLVLRIFLEDFGCLLRLNESFGRISVLSNFLR